MVQRLGNELYRARQEARLSQSEVSHGICSRPHLSRLERNRQLPGPTLLMKLCDRLGLPLDGMVEAYLREPEVGPRTQLRLARLLTDRGRDGQAERILNDTCQKLQTAGTIEVHRDDIIHTQVSLLRRRGKHNAALAHCRDLLDRRLRRPSQRYYLAQAHHLLGDTAFLCGKRELAQKHLLSAFNQVMGLKPDRTTESRQRVVDLHEGIVWSLARLLLRSRYFTAAESLLQLARMRWHELNMDAGPTEMLLVHLSFAHLGTGRLQEAEDILKMLAQDDDSKYEEAILCGLGTLRRITGEYEEAIIHLLAAWELDGSTDMTLQLTVAQEMTRCYLATKDFPRARMWLTRAERLSANEQATADPHLCTETTSLQLEMARATGETLSSSLCDIAECIANSPISAATQRAALISALRLALERTEDTAVQRITTLLADQLTVPSR